MARSKSTPSSDISNLLDTLKPSPSASPSINETSPAGEAPTVTIANIPPADRVLPGFAMADSPEELEGSAAALPPVMVNPPSPAGSTPQVRALDIPDADISGPSSFPTGNIRYESRIRILDAFQYPGHLRDAPDWIDRNWIGYNPDFDPLRNIEPGPALRVPTRSGDEMVWCRPGDYVVRQSVTLIKGLTPDEVIEVWARESFEKNFIPDRISPKPEPEVPSAVPAYESS